MFHVFDRKLRVLYVKINIRIITLKGQQLTQLTLSYKSYFTGLYNNNSNNNNNSSNNFIHNDINNNDININNYDINNNDDSNYNQLYLSNTINHKNNKSNHVTFINLNDILDKLLHFMRIFLYISMFFFFLYYSTHCTLPFLVPNINAGVLKPLSLTYLI